MRILSQIGVFHNRQKSAVWDSPLQEEQQNMTDKVKERLS